MKGKRLGRAGLVMVVMVVVLGCAPAVAAQSEGGLAVGASFSSKQGTDNDVSGGGGLGVLWRFGRGSEGWGFRYGTNWYSADIDQELAGTRQAFGRLRVRPIMAGYGYTRFIGRTKVSANLMGGYALNSFKLQPLTAEIYRRQFAMPSVDTDASNSLVVKPEVSIWFDMTKKIGVNVDAGYMITRPTVSVMTPGGPERHRVRADMLMLKVGAVYKVF